MFFLKNKNIIQILFTILPVVFLNVKHSTNIILLLLFIFSISYLKEVKYEISTKLKSNILHVQISVMLFLPFISTLISQLLRGEIYINNWDAPIRQALCVPIYLALVNGCLDNEKSIIKIWLTQSIPIGLIICLMSVIFYPSMGWGLYKTTYFVDPLSFCNYTLLFSILTLLGLIYYYNEISLYKIIFCSFAVFLGIHLSASSGARTGWISLPIIWTLIFVFLGKERLKNTFIISLFLIIIIAYLLINQKLATKFNLGFQELLHYKLHQINEDTSIGARLSFYRMGLEYFLQRPLTGWGDVSWMYNLNHEIFRDFASESTRLAPTHGFHNEIITNSVRSGIWGLISSLFFFFFVFHKAIVGIKSKISKDSQFVSLCLLVIILQLFFASMTTEITNLTFLSAFIGIMISLCMSQQYIEETKAGAQ